MQRLHLIIRGRVQGVGFRRATLKEAHRLGLKGWVRNRFDGSVECLAEGNRATLERFERWCHDGPLFAEVREVEVEWLEGKEEFEQFSVR